MRYRPQVDGLRAVAVLFVVLYHSSAAPFRHGYVGVDMFFVISGFVITDLILNELAEDRFSVLTFALRRLQRLVPALLTMLLGVLATGYFVLGPDQYSELGRESVYSSLFISNFYYLWHTGYFDLAARKLPLLHTWSVSVELQLYALLVAALWMVWRLAKRAPDRARVAGLLGLLSLLSLLAAGTFGSADFKSLHYGSQFRVWEFLLGGLLGFVPPMRRAKATIAWLGAAALLAAAGLAAPEGLVEHLIRLMTVCLGTACMLLGCTTGGTALDRFLGSQPIVFLGRLSYSLYLWHWPTLVLTRYYMGVDERSTAVNVVAPLIALSLAVLTFRFVEQPLRYARISARLLWGGLTGSLASVISAALLVTWTDGFISRFNPRMLPLRSKQVMWDWQCPQEIAISVSRRTYYTCAIGAPWESAAKHGVLWGDSHALQIAPLLDGLARSARASLAIWNACAPYVDGVHIQMVRPNAVEQSLYNSECTHSRDRGLAWIGSFHEPLLIVIAQAWSVHPQQLVEANHKGKPDTTGMTLFTDGLKEFLDDVRIRRNDVWLIADVPSSDYDIADCYIRSLLISSTKHCDQDPTLMRWKNIAPALDATNAVLKAMPDQFSNVRTLILSDKMCRSEGCITTVNGELLYRDSDHFRRNLPPDAQRALIELLDLGEVFSPYGRPD